MDKHRILDNVTVDNNGCWNWNKSTMSSGYGQLMENKMYWGAHRYSYTVFKGEIPNGMLVRHTCHNPSCCNPEHLEIGDGKDNYQDSIEVHRKAQSKRAKGWLIGNVKYATVREANNGTGICPVSIVKFTKNGVFDIEAYRAGCVIARKTPKV